MYPDVEANLATLLITMTLLWPTCVAWEHIWYRTTLTDQQRKTANAVLADLIEDAYTETAAAEKTQKTENSAKMVGSRKENGPSVFQESLQRKKVASPSDQKAEFAKIKDIDWTDPVMSKRYHPLCQILFHNAPWDAAAKRYKLAARASCSCSFIGETTVLLATHCFVSVNPPITPETANSIVVIPQQGMHGAVTKQAADHWKKNARVVTEWWFTGQYIGNSNRHQDVAFAKIDSPSPPALQGEFYTMIVPRTFKTVKKESYDLVGSKMIALGYPGRFGSKVVDYKGDLAVDTKAEEHPVLKLLGKLQRKDKSGVKQTTEWGLMHGMSGGPWLLNAKAINEATADAELRAKLEMAVVSVSSDAPDETVEAAKGNRDNVGPIFTPRLIEAAGLIIKGASPAQVHHLHGYDAVRLELTTTNEGYEAYGGTQNPKAKE